LNHAQTLTNKPALSLANVNILPSYISTSEVATNLLNNALIKYEGVNKVKSLDYLADINQSLVKANSIRFLSQIQANTRGSSLRLFSGDDLTLSTSDTHSNLGAAANELLDSQMPKSISPFSFVRLDTGVSNFSLVTANHSSKFSLLSKLTSMNQQSMIGAFSLDSSYTQPQITSNYAAKSLLPDLAKFDLTFSTIGVEFGETSFCVKDFNSASSCLSVIDSLRSYNPSGKQVNYAQFVKAMSKLNLTRFDCSLLSSAWLEGPSESKPVRSAPKASGDLVHLSSRVGGIHELFNNIPGQLQG